MNENRQQAVVVGVTGHRAFADAEKIEIGVVAALLLVTTRFAERPLTILSPLAEGADRLVVRAAQRIDPTARLIVPLPLPVADYLPSFANAESKAQFNALLDRADEVIELPPAPTRNEAYRAAGLYVLDHCDILIAVWDGQHAEGQSGTSEIVAQARVRNLPIAWIHAGNRKPGSEQPASLGEEQGQVTYERFPV